ncbi:hypothetical protein WICMUC_005317 [Wickerhamomyces mucosus]|uniref:Uncharacterized protein n=1 Tax=Wickerhamomyces mucosus TaxID=1378264 RepID=A0A9P8P9P1_9ASCO|nr:hypothetical protein WICMUC_005317 [Wickerhamomyces mucosus]
MSVNDWVPEQGFITITPEKVFGSNVLEIVLNWPFFIRDMSQMFSVVSMFNFNKVCVDSSGNNSWCSDKV